MIDAKSSEKPHLNPQQEKRLFAITGQRVSQIVQGHSPSSIAASVSDIATLPLFGAFVSLKRQGQLRSCCGYLGTESELAQAVQFAADRAAKDDPRFPPIATNELSLLEMEIWLLWHPEAIPEQGEDRVNAFTIGKHGLQVIRGNNRGLLLPGVAIEHQFDARTFLEQTCVKAGLARNAWLDNQTTVLRFEGYAIRGHLDPGEKPEPIPFEEDRQPAVAGTFYPASPTELNTTLDHLFAKSAKPQSYAAVMVPHAGWVYSGQIAAEVFQQVQFPKHAIILCPKHRPGGASWAVAPYHRWLFPGGQLDSDPDLARQLSHSITDLSLDPIPHRQEHAIEVHLPLIARLAPQTKLIGITIGGEKTWPALERFALELATFLNQMPEPPLLIISSDMNHFATDSENRLLDRIALDAIETRRPEHLYQTVQLHQISMCGMAPCVIVMEAIRLRGQLNQIEVVGYATSAEANGSTARVVGYAGLLFN